MISSCYQWRANGSNMGKVQTSSTIPHCSVFTVFPIPLHAKNVFRIEKTGTLLFCSVLLSDKIATALEQFKAEIDRKLRTI